MRILPWQLSVLHSAGRDSKCVCLIHVLLWAFSPCTCQDFHKVLCHSRSLPCLSNHQRPQQGFDHHHLDLCQHSLWSPYDDGITWWFIPQNMSLLLSGTQLCSVPSLPSPHFYIISSQTGYFSTTIMILDLDKIDCLIPRITWTLMGTHMCIYAFKWIKMSLKEFRIQETWIQGQLDVS